MYWNWTGKNSVEIRILGSDENYVFEQLSAYARGIKREILGYSKELHRCVHKLKIRYKPERESGFLNELDSLGKEGALLSIYKY